MEISYTSHVHVKIINLPLPSVTLQPVCSAFFSDIKLPPYFKHFHKGFDVAIKNSKFTHP